MNNTMNNNNKSSTDKNRHDVLVQIFDADCRRQSALKSTSALC